MKVIGVIGRKNAGKTTLTERLVRELVDRGLTVTTLKRSHHGLDLEVPGTDSHRHRLAGARQTVLASDARLAVMEETPRPLTLDQILTRIAPCDMVVAEGWKAGTHPRIEAWRSACTEPPLCLSDPTIAAFASDTPHQVVPPSFDLNDIQALADFVCSI
ncbi:hypothetical protein JANAI62_13910 [Jannaschia pagri]|uniref:Molybdopterin-guanine dinucleotide biosynthesis protein B (MobB) domain-containing protein n=1 Tax=Jannaschia pagri TaxID=2829797 RepID=A0ABQ4NK35_9RHOB|nr:MULTISPECIES: molybdopterin-guanine dinucleotide biosynthesis protein B [unclassified Jannaschia]GIT90937.1 hypothetical protein JANAI61_13950 [Jannaschia sp. AI_61]GIT94768.1 hypothetical protein JANAI62_13910 [Jannaschia sp. AI_62]